MKGWLKMFFKKKKEPNIYYIEYINNCGAKMSQVVLAFTKQRAVICLCQTVSVRKILSIEELKYE